MKALSKEEEKELKLKKLEAVKDAVIDSYSGRPGCMCGCNGKYKYSEKMRHVGSKERGYKVDDDEISDASVKRMTNKMRKLIESGEDVKLDYCFGDEKTATVGYFFYETPTRYNAIYFKNK